MLAILISSVAIPGGQKARAQDDTAPAAEKKEVEAPAAASGERPNLLVHIIKSAGIFFGPLLLLVSIGLVALIVLLAMDLRMGVAIPPGFVEEFSDTINKRMFKQAFEISRQDTSILARVMTAGMGRLQYGIEDAREAAFNTIDALEASKRQLITYLATIGTLGPMIGLVGTVYGMIISFMVLGRGGAPKPAELASGISHALVITLLGVALSVPAIFFHAFFTNRLTKIAKDTGTIADDLLTQMYHNSKRPPSTPSAPVAAPAPAGAIKQ
jgi:biopolymer transport protein ExbB